MLCAPQSMPSSSNVNLPSIHEMFPEHILQHSPPSRSHKTSLHRKSMGSSQFHSSAPGRPEHGRPRSFSSNNGRPLVNVADIPSNYSRPSLPMLSHPTMRPPVQHRGHEVAPSANDRQAHTSRQDSPIFSFNLLRYDSSSSSLQHIASSDTFPNRGGSSHGHHSQAKVANGSVPAFQVAVPTPAIASRDPPVSTRPPRSPEAPILIKTRNTTPPPPSYSSIISFPSQTHGSISRREQSLDAISDDEELAGSNNGKKHVCTTCFKRFNRPSSLRIHVNTHTGATPFRCPWPNCGREFNVNSNMRRHYRNHTTPGFSRSQSNDNRRRRRRVPPPPGIGFVRSSASPTIRMSDHLQEQQQYITSPPISTLNLSDDSEDDGSDPMDGSYSREEEEDELESLHGEYSSRFTRSPRTVYARSHDHGVHHARSPAAAYERAAANPSHHNHFSQSHVRSFSETTHRSACSPSSSASPSPPPAEPTYSPSAPYVRTLADSRVSTALRPAFHPESARGTRGIKEEPMSDIW